MYRHILLLLSVFFSFTKAQAAIPLEVEQQIKEHIASNGWKGLYYDVLPPIIQRYGYKTVVEVGVALGGHAEHLLKHTAIIKYIGVDPYLYNYDPTDMFNQAVGSYSRLGGQQSFDYLYEWVKNTRLQPFGKRCQLVRKTSVEAALLFENESIDCIFIDGDHRYKAVFDDLAAWFPKLKKGCMILGDDYWIPSVASAVAAFFAQEQKEVFFYASARNYKIWAVIK
jgi:hypothetical protein